jgi:hypothetical protein
MKTSKTFVLAAVAALSLGVGSALAQSEVPADAGNWTAPASTRTVPFNAAPVQAGSSDVTTNVHEVPFLNNYGTLANPG